MEVIDRVMSVFVPITVSLKILLIHNKYNDPLSFNIAINLSSDSNDNNMTNRNIIFQNFDVAGNTFLATIM